MMCFIRIYNTLFDSTLLKKQIIPLVETEKQGTSHIGNREIRWLNGFATDCLAVSQDSNPVSLQPTANSVSS
jgi:hypothetical protein